MTSVFNNLLVASPNGGGIFFIHGGLVHKLDSLDSTGLSVSGRRVLRGIQPSLVVLYQGTPLDINPTDLEFGDVHDVLIDGDSFYLVGTEGNEVVRFDAGAVELERWKLPGENDSWHVNCIAKWNGRLVFSAFGEFSRHREYKGATKDAGFVQDLLTGERLVTGLSQPHSLLPVGENLVLANSGEKELQEFAPDGTLVRSKAFDGYVRGICISDGHVFVGLSKSRNLPQAESQTAILVALDAACWDEVARLSLPVDEVYTIHAVDSEEIPFVTSAIAAHSTALLSSIVADKSSQIRGLDAELQRLRGEIGGLQVALAQVDEIEARLLNAIEGREEATASRQAANFVHSLESLTASIDASREEHRNEYARGFEHLASVVSEMDGRARDMHDVLLSTLDRTTVLQSRVSELETELKAAVDSLEVYSERSAEYEHDMLRARQELDESGQNVERLEAELRLVYGSRSMRLTRPLRAMGVTGRAMLLAAGSGVRAWMHLARNPRRYLGLAKGKRPSELAALVRGFLTRGGPKPVAPEPVRFDLRCTARPIVILTTRHCEYIARAMLDALARVGIVSEIIFEQPVSGYADVPHFVICPQMFPVLPGFYVAFQMEQSVSSRWFTADYIRRLENSFAVFDYSVQNISFLKEKGLSLKQIYYLPVGHLPGLASVAGGTTESGDYDVVFYGDASNERRQAYLTELQKHCRVKVVSEVFGEELYGILLGAKLVVNIHYYAGALLETTRIWECLSLGKLVVSECSTDMEDHGELEELVDFVEIGNIPAMVRRVRYWIEHESDRQDRLQIHTAALAGYFNRFDYFFYRFLLATDNISFDEFWRETGRKYRLESDRLCLNLPEYVERSREFARDNNYGFALFPGLRHSKGWLGCAMSYKYMIKLARESGLDRVTICEDDVAFPADYRVACATIDAYLADREEPWDIFSGLMADLHRDAKVLAVDEREGRTFVTTDRLISTVMNVYNQSVFDTVIRWDETNRDVETNTIDRYLEGKRALKVIVTDPFLVGHKEEQHSTIWEFQNSQYADLIAASSRLLKEKVIRFQAQRGARLKGLIQSGRHRHAATVNDTST